MIDAERISKEALLAVRLVTGFGTNVNIAIIIDCPALSPAKPAGVFSEIKIDRLVALTASVKQDSDLSHDTSLRAIAMAMKGPAHG